MLTSVVQVILQGGRGQTGPLREKLTLDPPACAHFHDHAASCFSLYRSWVWVGETSETGKKACRECLYGKWVNKMCQDLEGQETEGLIQLGDLKKGPFPGSDV